MRTVKFGSILDGVCAAMGSERQALPPAEAAAYIEAISQAVEWAWESYDWPELSTTTPVTALASGSVGMIPWGGEDAPTPLKLYEADPRLSREVREVGFSVEQGSIIVACAGDLWMKSRPRPPVWTAEVYDASTEYQKGDTVYNFESGHGYVAKETTLGRPTSDETVWQRLWMPFVFSRAVKLMAHSNLLGGREGQAGAAAAKRSDAEKTLVENIRVISVQSQQFSYYR